MYHLIVVARDDQSPDVLTSTAAVTVYITDVNDNSPAFINSVGTPVDMTSDNKSALNDVIVSYHARRGSLLTRVSIVHHVTSLLQSAFVNY